MAASKAQLKISEGKASLFRQLLTGDDQTNAYLYMLYQMSYESPDHTASDKEYEEFLWCEKGIRNLNQVL
jgi:hypothetical protein